MYTLFIKQFDLGVVLAFFPFLHKKLKNHLSLAYGSCGFVFVKTKQKSSGTSGEGTQFSYHAYLVRMKCQSLFFARKCWSLTSLPSNCHMLQLRSKWNVCFGSWSRPSQSTEAAAAQLLSLLYSFEDSGQFFLPLLASGFCFYVSLVWPCFCVAFGFLLL